MFGMSHCSSRKSAEGMISKRGEFLEVGEEGDRVCLPSHVQNFHFEASGTTIALLHFAPSDAVEDGKENDALK